MSPTRVSTVQSELLDPHLGKPNRSPQGPLASWTLSGALAVAPSLYYILKIDFNLTKIKLKLV